MALLAYTKTGAKKETAPKLDNSIFGLELNHHVLDLAYRSYLASGRAVSATTLKRGEVRGGGKKPWRQKGTGRARVGSSRVPTWRGGGVVFGPSGNENYSINLPIKVKRLAIRQALSAQAADDKIMILETFDSPEGKVKPTLELMGKLKVEGNILLIVSLKDPLVDRATRNIPGLKAVSANYLNVFDILNADTIILTEKALPVIEQWLGDNPPKKAEKVADKPVKKEKDE
jgi:large subunit ribosomal protein L4